MTNFEMLPRIEITHSPTPLELAPRLSDNLGCKVYIKRDDCTGLAGGGNKTRKLEYLLADALQKGADTLVTIGGLQSNHARQTAAVAAKFGLGCELVLQEVTGTPNSNYKDNGNFLIDQLLGANIHPLSLSQDSDEYTDLLIKTLKDRGQKPYLIPVGGSNEIGSYGYIRCANEILAQIKQKQLEIDQIILASGSAGTQAGLLAGLIAAKSEISVLGINVSRPEIEQTNLVEELLKKTLLSIGLDQKLSKDRVFTNDNYYGDGYGIINESTISAIKRCAELEGILLDPVYTGKAMAGLIDLCARKLIAPRNNLLFLHTGGSQGLFAYSESF